MFNRIVRALKMDGTIFAEVGKDPKYMQEATIIAVVVGVVAALGSLFVPLLGFVNFLLGLVTSILLGWVLWSLVVKWVAGLQGGKSNSQEVLRAMAYAGVPRAAGLLAFIPFLGWLLAFAGGIYSAWLSVVAIRQLEGFDNQKAIITAVAAWAVFFVGSLIISAIFGSVLAASYFSAAGISNLLK
jgi:hypothetical protein